MKLPIAHYGYRQGRFTLPKWVSMTYYQGLDGQKWISKYSYAFVLTVLLAGCRSAATPPPEVQTSIHHACIAQSGRSTQTSIGPSKVLQTPHVVRTLGGGNDIRFDLRVRDACRRGGFSFSCDPVIPVEIQSPDGTRLSIRKGDVIKMKAEYICRGDKDFLFLKLGDTSPMGFGTYLAVNRVFFQ